MCNCLFWEWVLIKLVLLSWKRVLSLRWCYPTPKLTVQFKVCRYMPQVFRARQLYVKPIMFIKWSKWVMFNEIVCRFMKWGVLKPTWCIPHQSFGGLPSCYKMTTGLCEGLKCLLFLKYQMLDIISHNFLIKFSQFLVHYSLYSLS